MQPAPTRPSRLLLVLPSWVGDTVMATPTLRAVRRALPGAFIGALVRPGLDDLLAGLPFLDELHIDRAAGVMGPKRAAAKLRPRRYDAALLLTNSFSTALITRLAGIPQRIGYDRDGRAVLLTTRVPAPLRRDVEPFKRSATSPASWAPVPACDYYFNLARGFLETVGAEIGGMGAMQLATTPAERAAADDLLAQLSIPPTARFAIINPGGNNPAKRWPPERFAAIADHLVERHNMTVLITGAPAESQITAAVAAHSKQQHRARIIDLPAFLSQAPSPKPQATLGSLKALIARASIMITNDTGPRHIAAAFNIPVVTLFGPTDHRWTTIPFERERIILADPSLPEEEIANDHPARCAIERIAIDSVRSAIDRLV